MSEAVAKLLPLLDALTDAERAEVSEYLHGCEGADETDEALTEEAWEAALADEVNRRVTDLESGRTTLVPGDEVMKRLKEKYG